MIPAWRVLGLFLLGFAPVAVAGEASGPRFLGHVDIHSNLAVDGMELGGLSGLTRLGENRYLAVSDNVERPRAFVLHIALTDERLEPSGVRVEAMIPLRTASGGPLKHRIDAEGVALTVDGRILVADEGRPALGAPSRLLWFDENLRAIGAIDLAAKTLPCARTRTPDSYGIRRNLGLESLTITPDGGLDRHGE